MDRPDSYQKAKNGADRFHEEDLQISIIRSSNSAYDPTSKPHSNKYSDFFISPLHISILSPSIHNQKHFHTLAFIRMAAL